MASQDVERVREWIAAVPADMRWITDDPALIGWFSDLLDPEFELVLAGHGESLDLEESLGIGGVFRGIEGVSRGMGEWLTAFESYRNVTTEVIDAGDAVVTLNRQTGRTRAGVEIEIEGGSVWRFRDGKVLRLEAYLDRASALRAAGLSETAR